MHAVWRPLCTSSPFEPTLELRCARRRKRCVEVKSLGISVWLTHTQVSLAPSQGASKPSLGGSTSNDIFKMFTSAERRSRRRFRLSLDRSLCALLRILFLILSPSCSPSCPVLLVISSPFSLVYHCFLDDLFCYHELLAGPLSLFPDCVDSFLPCYAPWCASKS